MMAFFSVYKCALGTAGYDPLLHMCNFEGFYLLYLVIYD